MKYAIPTAPIGFWEHFDLITVGVLAVVIAWLVIDHRRKTGSILGSISQMVAASPRSSVIFSATMTVFFPLYYAFIWFWIGPRVGAPVGFYYMAAISAACEMIFVWVPATSGWRRRLHETMAGMVGVAMLALPILILTASRSLSEVARLSIEAFLVGTVILAVLISSKKTRSHTFTYEVTYCLIFLGTMSIIAHW